VLPAPNPLGRFGMNSREGAVRIRSTSRYAGSRAVELHERVVGVGLPAQEYGTHSLRRTKASIICKATGNLLAVQILPGHAKIDSTVPYLRADVEDALETGGAHGGLSRPSCGR
jgi:site-specific recombinase XerC